MSQDDISLPPFAIPPSRLESRFLRRKGPHLVTTHAACVAAAGEVFCDFDGGRVLNVCGLLDRLPDARTLLRAFGWLHDLGKCSPEWQRQVLPLACRHEVSSALAVWKYDAGRQWIRQSPVWYELMCMVLGHHLRFHEGQCNFRQTLKINLFDKDNPQNVAVVSSLLSRVGEALGIPPPPALTTPEIRYTEFGKHEESLWGMRHLQPEVDFRFLGVMKALAVAADVAASALTRRPRKTRNKKLSRRKALSPEVVRQNLNRMLMRTAVESRLRRAAGKCMKGKPPYAFQLKVAASRATLVVVEGGCGSGKTGAAYLRGAEIIRRDGPRKFVLANPLTTIGTLHFETVTLRAGRRPRLVHCRAQADWSMRLRRWKDKCREKSDDERHDVAMLEEKLEGFWAWTGDVFSLTADSLLNLMVNSSRGMVCLPFIANSIIVFDEVHAYSPKMFRLLLGFIDLLRGVQIMLMSASLSPARRAAIAEVRGDAEFFEGDRTREAWKRYRIHTHAERLTPEETWAHVGLTGLALWIRNTVSSAVQTYRSLQGRVPNERLFLFHARFKYKDKIDIQSRCIKAFKPRRDCVLVTTQIAQSSLDLSATTLLTDLAPVPDLIQRLGRLARSMNRPSARKIGECHISSWPGIAHTVGAVQPYSQESLDTALDFLEFLGDGVHSQSDLAEAMLRTNGEEEIDVRSVLKRQSFWSDVKGGVGTKPGVVREPGYTVSVIMQEDLDDWHAGKRRGQTSQSVVPPVRSSYAHSQNPQAHGAGRGHLHRPPRLDCV
jgi:CRISPR-associated endonuclease/helicase Cas3